MDITSLFEARGLLAGIELGAKAPASVSEQHSMRVSVDAPHGIVKSVSAEFTTFDEADRASALFAALAPKVATHFTGVIEKKSPRLIRIKVAQPSSVVELRHFRQNDADGAHDSVTLSVVLDEAAVPDIAANEVGFDVRAVALALATKKFPAQVVEAAAIRVFTRPDGDAEWSAVISAAATEHARRKAELVAAVLSACPWGELKYGANWPAAKLLNGMMQSTIAYRFDRKPFSAWSALTQNDLFAAVELLHLPVAERGAAAAHVYRALELGDASALEWVRTRIKPPTTFLYAIFDATDEIEARLFGLIAGTLSTELEQLTLAFRAATSNAARAATTWFAQQRGLERAPIAVSVKQGSHWQLAAESLAGFFSLVKEHFPQHFDAVVAAFADRKQLYGPDLIPALCGVVGEVVSKTVFRLGATEFKVTARNVTASPAKAKPAKKVTKKK